MLAALQYAHGESLEKNFNREYLLGRSYKTWLGEYAFSEEKILEIEGLDDLYLLVYRCPGKEGTLIEFANLSTNGIFHLLQEADLKSHDVTSTFEGADVFPGIDEAEVIVRWRHPGQGGLRSVEKYCYKVGSLIRISRSSFVSDGKKGKWVSDQTTGSSTSAKRSPLSDHSLSEAPTSK